MINIQCTGCQKKYNIPDEKIPEGKALELPCPACKTPMKILKPPRQDVKIPPRGDIFGEILMKKIVKESKALPPMPQIIAKATEVLSSEKTGFKEVGKVLETDQAMATRVLKLANSAYYALANPVSSVQQASALLGFQTLMELITVVSTSKMMGKHLSGYGMDAKEVWRHSLSVAIGAKVIAENKFPFLVNDAFNAGLIHDSGMLILDDHVAREKEIYEQLLESGQTIQQAENGLFGFDHGEIASEFFQKWKLPSSQTHAIRYHHAPSKSGKDLLSYVLHVADAIDNRNATERNFTIEPEAMSFIGLTEEELEGFSAQISEGVAHIMETIV